MTHSAVPPQEAVASRGRMATAVAEACLAGPPLPTSSVLPRPPHPQSPFHGCVCVRGRSPPRAALPPALREGTRAPRPGARPGRPSPRDRAAPSQDSVDCCCAPVLPSQKAAPSSVTVDSCTAVLPYQRRLLTQPSRTQTVLASRQPKWATEPQQCARLHGRHAVPFQLLRGLRPTRLQHPLVALLSAQSPPRLEVASAQASAAASGWASAAAPPPWPRRAAPAGRAPWRPPLCWPKRGTLLPAQLHAPRAPHALGRRPPRRARRRLPGARRRGTACQLPIELVLDSPQHATPRRLVPALCSLTRGRRRPRRRPAAAAAGAGPQRRPWGGCSGRPLASSARAPLP